MGFLSSIGKMFGQTEPERRDNAAPMRRVKAPAMASTTTIGVADQASGLRERVQREQARRDTRGKSPVVSEPDASAPPSRETELAESAPAPKNKQELFEDLQRNYRDVVDLVKKVDAHLDRNEQRSREMMSIAQRIDAALPALERFPEQVREQLDGLKTEVVGAIQSSAQRGDQRSAEIQQTLGTIGERIDHTSVAHGQLVTTMAGFRETLGELAQHSSRTSDVLQSIDSRRQEREDELTKMLIASRRWSVTTLAVTLLGVSIAVSIAVVALVMQA